MNNQGIAAIFAWIFILIAGALIITLFVILAQTQAEAAKQSSELRAFQNVNAILTTQQTTKNFESTVAIPQADIRMTCRITNSGGMISQLAVGRNTQDHRYTLIAGRDMQTDTLSLFTKSWEAPFNVGNVLYISNPTELLAWKAHPNVEDDFEASIPESITSKELVAQVDGSRYSVVREVRFHAAVADVDSQPSITGNNVISISVKPENNEDPLSRGIVTVNGKDYPYIGEAMLYGYIWQGDQQRADCLQKKFDEVLDAQIDLQVYRVQELSANSVFPECRAELSSTELVKLRDDVDFTDLIAASNAVDALQEANDQLFVGEQCASIY